MPLFVHLTIVSGDENRRLRIGSHLVNWRQEMIKNLSRISDGSERSLEKRVVKPIKFSTDDLC